MVPAPDRQQIFVHQRRRFFLVSIVLVNYLVAGTTPGNKGTDRAAFLSRPHPPPAPLPKKATAATVPNPIAGAAAKKDLRSSFAPAGKMSSIFPRGGGGPKQAVFRAAALDSGDEQDDWKKAQEALASMRYTYRTCFAAVLADLVITLIDDSVWKRPFTWLVAVDIFDSLNLVMFGFGLLKVTRLYGDSLAARLDITNDAVRDACRTMAQIWRATAWSLVGLSTSLAAALRRHAGLSPGPGTFSAPVGVVAAAAVGSVFIRARCARDAAEAVRAEVGKGGPLKPDAERARLAGFVTCRNMALCMGSFALMATVHLATWIVTPADWIGRIFTVTSFVTPFTIAGLLATLYKKFLRAIVTVSGERSRDSKIDFDVYDDLYEAQKGFYSNVGDTLRSATVFSLLPYAFAPIKPYVMPYLITAAKFVAPSLAGDL